MQSSLGGPSETCLLAAFCQRPAWTSQRARPEARCCLKDGRGSRGVGFVGAAFSRRRPPCLVETWVLSGLSWGMCSTMMAAASVHDQWPGTPLQDGALVAKMALKGDVAPGLLGEVCLPGDGCVCKTEPVRSPTRATCLASQHALPLPGPTWSRRVAGLEGDGGEQAPAGQA